jgi:hypothetical protein
MVEYSVSIALIWPIDNILRIKSSLSFCNTDAYLGKVRPNDPYKKIEVDDPLGLARGEVCLTLDIIHVDLGLH